MFFVMFISIICFILVSILLPKDITVPMKVLVRLLLVPIIAGISYEILRAAGRSENKFLTIISKPGMWMQKLTTKEPDDSMIEVGIKAVEAVFDWETFLKENAQEFELENDPLSEDDSKEDLDDDESLRVEFDDDIAEFKSKNSGN